MRKTKEREGSVSVSSGFCIKGRAREGRKERGRLEGFRGGAMLALCLLTYIGPLESASPFQLLFLLRSVFTATDDCLLFLCSLLFLSLMYFPRCVHFLLHSSGKSAQAYTR